MTNTYKPGETGDDNDELTPEERAELAAQGEDEVGDGSPPPVLPASQPKGSVPARKLEVALTALEEEEISETAKDLKAQIDAKAAAAKEAIDRLATARRDHVAKKKAEDHEEAVLDEIKAYAELFGMKADGNGKILGLADDTAPSRLVVDDEPPAGAIKLQNGTEVHDNPADLDAAGTAKGASASSSGVGGWLGAKFGK